MSDSPNADCDRARLLLQRVLDEKRIRHDHAYPMEVGPHHCDGCDLQTEIQTYVTPPGCICPSGLGYRFHRHPCPRTGEIEPRDTPPDRRSDG